MILFSRCWDVHAEQETKDLRRNCALDNEQQKSNHLVSISSCFHNLRENKTMKSPNTKSLCFVFFTSQSTNSLSDIAVTTGYTTDIH